MKKRIAILLIVSFIMATNDLMASGDVIGIHPENPRYFKDAGGKALYLAGSHTWYTIHRAPDRGIRHTDADTFSAFLDFLESHGHNYTRLWVGYAYLNRPNFMWRRTGPGVARDGKPKFDLSRFDQRYFDTLKKRLAQLQSRGLYASVMIFGSHNEIEENPANTAWHPANNVNAIQVTDGNAFFDLTNTGLRRVQEKVIEKMIDELNSFDNIFFEIINEASFPASAQWQKAMVRHAKAYERHQPNQHLWGITADYPGPANTTLKNGPHDWWSPIDETVDGYNYTVDGGPAAYADKIVIVDSDHYHGGLYRPTPADLIAGIDIIWKTFMRGRMFAFMDCHTAIWDTYDYDVGCNQVGVNAFFDPIRDAMGATVTYSRRLLDLAAMLPSEALSSTGYCLADPGSAYLVYQPAPPKGHSAGRFNNLLASLWSKTGARGWLAKAKPLEFTVDVRAGSYRYEWFDARHSQHVSSGRIEVAAGKAVFHPPCDQAVLYLWKSNG